MRLMIHTLAALANSDGWRADWIPSSMEGWLNLLLPLVWACVAALAVQEEPLVGDRNFWTTRPYRWPSLLGAKLMFVIRPRRPTLRLSK